EIIGHRVIAFDDDLEVAPGDPGVVDDEVRARRGAAEGVRALAQRVRATVDAHTGLDGALACRRAGCGRADGGGRTCGRARTRGFGTASGGCGPGPGVR